MLAQVRGGCGNEAYDKQRKRVLRLRRNWSWRLFSRKTWLWKNSANDNAKFRNANSRSAQEFKKNATGRAQTNLDDGRTWEECVCRGDFQGQLLVLGYEMGEIKERSQERKSHSTSNVDSETIFKFWNARGDEEENGKLSKTGAWWNWDAIELTSWIRKKLGSEKTVQMTMRKFKFYATIQAKNMSSSAAQRRTDGPEYRTNLDRGVIALSKGRCMSIVWKEKIS